MTGATEYPAYRGYRCVIPGCERRVSYKRLMCDDDWRTVPVQLRTLLRDAFRDAVARRPGARDRFHELREQCHQAALAAAGVAPQAGDGTTVTRPPAVHPPSRPAAPPAAVPSPHDPPLPGTGTPTPNTPGIASGGQVGAGDVGGVDGVETVDLSHGANPGTGEPPAPTAQTPAPTSADGASPIAGEQEGEGAAQPMGGGSAAPEPHTDHTHNYIRK